MEEEEFQVDRILDKRVKNSKTEYLLSWKGYGPEENTWEPKANLNCPKLMAVCKTVLLFIKLRSHFKLQNLQISYFGLFSFPNFSGV